MVLAAFVLLSATAERGESFGLGDKGTSGAQFLKISPAARPAAMGEAFAGIADDINSIYYNPAGLGTLKKVELTGSHSSLFQDISYENAALAVPLLSWTKDQRPKNVYGTLGISISNLTVSNIERRGTTETDTPIETFGSSDFAYAMSYGVTVPNTGLSLGVNAKYIDQQLDTAKSTAFGMDLGSLYRAGRAGFAFGVRNVGTKTKFVSQADPLPMTIYTGAAYKFTPNWMGSVEVDLPRDNSAVLAFGTEYRHDFGDKITGAARLGYNTNNTDGGGLSGLAFGFGLGYGNFDFDFALVPFGDLGSEYKYSMHVKF
jgi:hypothetical protein